ncbi:hypothetical protein [Azospirillum palustre]
MMAECPPCRTGLSQHQAAGAAAPQRLLVQPVGYPLTEWALSIWSPGTSMPTIDPDTLM